VAQSHCQKLRKVVQHYYQKLQIGFRVMPPLHPHKVAEKQERTSLTKSVQIEKQKNQERTLVTKNVQIENQENRERINIRKNKYIENELNTII
jgi:hypothetical protein